MMSSLPPFLFKHRSIVILKTVLPQFSFCRYISSSETNTTPSLSKEDIAKHRAIFESIGKVLGVKQLDDWYKIPPNEILKLEGNMLTTHYGSSLHRALSTLFPHHDWKTWAFGLVPKKYWDDVAHQKDYFEWVSKRIGINKLEDWYSVQMSDIQNKGGAGVLRVYGFSLSKALHTIYPDHPWHVWKLYGDLPQGYWRLAKNRRLYLDWISKEFNLKSMEDWYQVEASEIRKKSGSELLDMFEKSFAKVIMSTYTEHNWQSWEFEQKGTNKSWNIKENSNQFLDQLEKELKIHDLDEWKTVPVQLMAKRGGIKLLRKYNGKLGLLREVYPQHEWGSLDIAEGVSQEKSIDILKTYLEEIFPNQKIQSKYLLSFQDENNLELNFFLPKMNLGFQYVGEQQNNSNSQMKEDERKRRIIKRQHGINIIMVPSWWDHTKKSLMATISKERPDLLSVPKNTKAISETSPQREAVELQIRIQKATKWDSKEDPKGWWMSEKYDGIRANWDMVCLKLPNGKEIPVPEFFTKDLPKNQFLEGELWLGYRKSDEYQSLLRDENSPLWKDAKFMIFDGLSPKIFEERCNLFKTVVPSSHPNIQLIQMIQCNGKDHLESYLKEVEERGGNGVMLRKPHSYYENNRTEYLKTYQQRWFIVPRMNVCCKRERSDQVILTKHSPNEVRFNIVSHKELQDGDIIEFKCNQVVDGVPKDATFVRLNFDTKWNNLMREHYHYYLHPGNVKAFQQPQCQGCSKQLTREELRVSVDALYVATKAVVASHFCAKRNCIEQVLDRKDKTVRLPPYEGKVFVPACLRFEAINIGEKIEWIIGE